MSIEVIEGKVMLQWGHSLSAMETFGVTGASSELGKLQWGHSLSAMETGGFPQRADRVCEASMGP